VQHHHAADGEQGEFHSLIRGIGRPFGVWELGVRSWGMGRGMRGEGRQGVGREP
jgi:hypothetical protein